MLGPEYVVEDGCISPNEMSMLVSASTGSTSIEPIRNYIVGLPSPSRFQASSRKVPGPGADEKSATSPGVGGLITFGKKAQGGLALHFEFWVKVIGPSQRRCGKTLVPDVPQTDP